MNHSSLIRIAQKYGTPTYVFDTGALKDRVRAVRALWGDRISLCYSIKANPFLIPAMLEVLDHLEVCSPGELEICENLHVPMTAVVYSGVNKEPSDVHQAVSDGVGICTAESLRHVKLLEAEGKAMGRSIPVLLRLGAGSQFGMPREDLLYIIRNRQMWPHLDIQGIHYFVGTQRKNRDLHQQKEELEMLRQLFENVRREEGFSLKKLEYGPGLPVPLFVKDDFSDTLAPAREIADALKRVTEWTDLTVEAGRFFTTECGYYLTKVMDLKTADGGKRYCIVDGGINHVNYLGQIMGMKLPVIRHFAGNGDPDADPGTVPYVPDDGDADRNQETADEDGTAIPDITASAGGTEGEAGGHRVCEYAICGSLCTTNDDLVRSVKMREIRPGDVLVFENIGAYSVTEGIYLFLSRKMPRIVLYNDDSDVRMVRDFAATSTLNTIQDAFMKGTAGDPTKADGSA